MTSSALITGGNVHEMFQKIGLDEKPIHPKGVLCHVAVVQKKNNVTIGLCVQGCRDAPDFRLNLFEISSSHYSGEYHCRVGFQDALAVNYSIRQECEQNKIVVNVSGKRKDFIRVQILLPKSMFFYEYCQQDGIRTAVMNDRGDSQWYRKSLARAYRKGLAAGMLRKKR